MHKGKRMPSGGVAQSFIICFLISALLIILLSLISAVILGALEDPTGNVGLFSLGAMLLSAIASGVCCVQIKGEDGVRFSALVALAVVLVMLLINVILSQGRVSVGAFMNYGCYLGCFILAAYLGKRKDRHRKHRH